METEDHIATVTAARCRNVHNSSGNLEMVRQNIALCCNTCDEVSGHHWGKLIENNATKSNTHSAN
jgi:hypothetical protein